MKDAEADVCKPGGIITGARQRACVRLQEELPRLARAIADAEANVNKEITIFEEALEVVNRTWLKSR